MAWKKTNNVVLSAVHFAASQSVSEAREAHKEAKHENEKAIYHPVLQKDRLPVSSNLCYPPAHAHLHFTVRVPAAIAALTASIIFIYSSHLVLKAHYDSFDSCAGRDRARARCDGAAPGASTLLMQESGMVMLVRTPSTVCAALILVCSAVYCGGRTGVVLAWICNGNRHANFVLCSDNYAVKRRRPPPT
ncbi:hypothetical protein SCHPADRAFT_896680 [Schizopora paradoxa]|uniref:Uncharacterized protein n=1 Tax=Schizopora paradoxa TaxID=27342 RepID=A0A0H2QZI3_9AGAM|nr:hypothetical protein SCHPADRAFT_896680 [Schizopora paradoxa]